MPRNSTGNYTLPLPPVVSGELIEATWANTTLDDIGQALTDSLDRYGRGGMLASFLFADGTVSNPGAAWANAPGTGFFRDSAHLGFVWNGAEQASFNSNGMSGKINSMHVVGSLNVDKTATFSFDNDAEVPQWYLGRASADRFTLFNAITSIEAISVDPLNQNVTFSNSIIGPLVLVQADWGGVQFAGTDGVQCGQLFGRPDGGLTVYAFDIDGVNQAVTDFLSTGAVFHASATFETRINSTVDGSGNSDAFVWSYGGQSRLTMKSIGGWAGFEWHMPAVSFMSVYQVSDGSLRWLAGQDIGAPIMSFHPSGQIRAKSFLAAATPG